MRSPRPFTNLLESDGRHAIVKNLAFQKASIEDGAMPFAGSPKAFARDIAEGFIDLTPLVLKKFTRGEIKIIHTNLNLILREVRGQGVSQDDIPAIRHKNLRLQRLNQALLVLHTYCKQHKIPL